MPVRAWDNTIPSVGISIVWTKERVNLCDYYPPTDDNAASFMEIIGIVFIPQILISIQTAAKEEQPCRTPRIMPGGVVAESTA
jgi:hypothetical protein